LIQYPGWIVSPPVFKELNESIFQDLKEIEGFDEAIFVEGGSSDSTFDEISKEILKTKDSRLRLMRQNGVGKFNAVLTAISASNAESFAIWDGDNTISAEDQNLMISLYRNSHHEIFVTANRLNPQRHSASMRIINLIGNKLFSRLTYATMGINVPDVLAGTKIFPRRILDESVACDRAMQADPFGDLYLLSRASLCGIEVKSMACEYRARKYGSTNIKRWSGGWAMLKFLNHLVQHRCHKRR
jgi:glycosyltransferase involved in cell wall biosynthesis